MASSGHYFHEKGRRAEGIIHDLATVTFLTDWCYPNPKKPDGKEICDLLVVFDDTAIIWQIKDLKVDAEGKYKEAEVAKNLRQLSGARRAMFDLKLPIELTNPRRGKELFNPDQIKTVHLISVLMGESEKPFPFVQFLKDKMIHVFTREFADLALSELDTVSDFCAYLRAKEAIDRNKFIVVQGGEENLLASYLQNLRGFSWMDNHDRISITNSCWPSLISNPQFIAKKVEDEISYGWDAVIDRAHDGTSEGYERLARELARPDRFTRRVISKSFYEAYSEYMETRPPIFRRFSAFGDTTYCFLLMEDGQGQRENRKRMLQMMCFVARGLPPMNNRVVGVATEAENRSYDYCFRHQPHWSETDAANKLKIQEATGIFLNPRRTQSGEDEYPAIPTT